MKEMAKRAALTAVVKLVVVAVIGMIPFTAVPDHDRFRQANLLGVIPADWTVGKDGGIKWAIPGPYQVSSGKQQMSKCFEQECSESRWVLALPGL